MNMGVFYTSFGRPKRSWGHKGRSMEAHPEPEAPTLLLMGESEDERAAVSRALRDGGYAVLEAADGAAALRLVAQRRPHLAVLEFTSRDPAASEVCRRMKDDVSVPVVLLVPVADGDAMGKARACRADAVLPASVDARLLLASVQALLRTPRTEADLARLVADLDGQRRFLQAMVDNAPEAIMIADATARVVLANRAAADILGRPIPMEGDIERHAAMHILSADGTPCPPRQLPLMRAVLDGENFRGEEMITVLPDGRRRHMLGNVTPVRDREGNIAGAVLVFQDITERKRSEQELARLLEMERGRSHEARLLETILEATPSWLAYLDADLRFVRVNQAYAQALGRRPEEFPGRTVEEMLAAAPEAAHIIREAWEAGTVLEREETVVIPSSIGPGVTTEYVDLTLAPVRGDDGDLEGLVVSVTDVTDRVRRRKQVEAAEQERSREARLLRAVQESTGSALAYLDRDLRIILLNAAAERTLAVPRAHLIGRPLAEALPDLRDVIPLLEDVLRTGEPQELLELPHIVPGRPELGTRCFRVSLVPVRDHAGEVEGLVASITDVTAQVQQRELLLAAERARAQLAESMSSEISHRIKNNLMMITGLLQMQAAQQQSPEVAAALKDTLARLLAFAGIHEQMQTTATEDVDLLDAARRIAAVIRRVFAEQEVEITVEGTSVLYNSRTAANLIVILNELITNSVKYGAPGPDGVLHVEVRIATEEGRLRLSVWNTGDTLPPGFDISARPGMGLRLISDAVVSQGRGRFTLARHRGGTLAHAVIEEAALQ
jgi:PAS domain S-box-containing protein